MNSAKGRSNAGSAKEVMAARESGSRASKAGDDMEEGHESQLNAGLRDRLVDRLDQAGISTHARTAYLAALTRRAAQTVSRWLDRRQPGLPDLASCERLCRQLPCSADWLLGLPQQEAPSGGKRAGVAVSCGRGATDPVLEMLGGLAGMFGDCEPLRMNGDDMAPRIRDGDLDLVDRSSFSLSGNGIYAVELDGRALIRKVESRIGTGLVFRCESPAYEDCVVRDAAAARRMGLRVLGRVVGIIGAQRFTHG